ncbi:alpha-tocopherol transfer protein-like [Neocloeon triangulifer]|uniref:alpha-tocopherol transfer protein-like n=1 Tax=Neocloeon triangulifer TaxID=2078957 RepID=UPI00286F8DE6|nr:alpha-tocopherol transfer protein-like [Neocloeon triangulifer]
MSASPGKLNQKIVPFLKGLSNEFQPLLKKHKEDIQHVQKWMTHQRHLPTISDEFVLLFLHSCEYSLEKAKTTIETYFTIRAGVPEFFARRDPKTADVKNSFDVAEMIAVPKSTNSGYRVLLYRLKETEPSKANFVELMKAFFVFADIRISEDGLAPGYIVIFDMKGVSIGHLTRVSLPSLKKYMVYIQEAHPARLKAIHVIHCVSFMDRVMALVKPLMKGELMGLLHLHTGGVECIKDIPQEILPEDYGGKAPSTPKIHEADRKRTETEYVEWLKAEEAFRADESRRAPGSGKSSSQLFGMEGSFRKLSID